MIAKDQKKEREMKRFWGLTVLYLVIGIGWASFMVQKDLREHNYSVCNNKENARGATVEMLANTFLWPVSIIHEAIEE